MWPIVEAVARAGDTYALPTDLTPEHGRDVWMAPPPWRTVVAVDTDGRIVGTAKYGPNQPAGGSHVANASFMVDPAVRGRGVGRRLGEHVIDAARNEGYRAMQFNAVVETNTSAVALWQSLGFEVLTTVPGAFRHPTDGLVGLHIMHRRL